MEHENEARCDMNNGLDYSGRAFDYLAVIGSGNASGLEGVTGLWRDFLCLFLGLSEMLKSSRHMCLTALQNAIQAYEICRK